MGVARERELLTVLDPRLAGKSWRATAVDLYGAKRVAADWNTDAWIRSRVRRRGKKARMLRRAVTGTWWSGGDVGRESRIAPVSAEGAG